MSSNAQHCSFVLLAEFDIDRGAQLTYQFPQPLGTDEGLLANLMLPDGAEKQLEDWTVFFLNQTPFNTIAPVLALEESTVNGHDQDESGRGTDKPELLYVLNIVRTKHDKTVRRGAVVKAMAICTRHPFIEMFKPVLLLALDDYYSAPSQDCLARLFDAINAMDISAAPKLNRHEKLIMRHSERKDIFAEKFFVGRPSPDPSQGGARTSHRPMPSNGSHSSFEEGILQRTKERVEGRERAGTEASIRNAPPPAPSTQYSPSENSFSLGGSAVWVGDESGLLEHAASLGGPSSVGSNGSSVTASKGRRSTDASSSSSHGQHRGIDHGYGGATPMIAGSSDPHLRAGMMKDTHFFQTTIDYKGHQLPIKMPLSTFPEEVGDYSLIQLIQTFSNPAATISGPLHPHLHTNGSLTHPIILLFNALVTGKRIIFLGHNRPAREVSSYVLSACALGSGCGTILRGFIERAFPYANLINREEWESIPAYIAGVTNPIFESSGSWDLLCDVGTGRMIVSKDIHISCPPQTSPSGAPPLITRSGTLRAESSIGSEDDIGRVPGRGGEVASQKSDFVAKADNPDNVFIEDIITAINYHFGESTVRARFTDYVQRFVRLASKYEEDVLGVTSIGYPSASFTEGHGDHPQLGSGVVFIDEGAGQRELAIHASRIEGWRRTATYKNFQEDFKRSLQTNALQGFDVMHQLWRLRHAKNMCDLEAELIMRSMAENVQTYDQVVELLALSPPHSGGLLPLSYGLFHQQELVRDLTVDLFNQLRVFPVGVQFLQALNHFQRYAYVRQAHARENRMRDLAPPAQAIPPHMNFSRTSSYGV
ncbi:spindle pole body interacting protein [Dentipellis sp. KUC8613]|nr:spindle pole body interacting protein [Dentipellis sp. KUC8613]